MERFGDIITESGTNGADKMGRSYNEKDFECECSSYKPLGKEFLQFFEDTCSIKRLTAIYLLHFYGNGSCRVRIVAGGRTRTSRVLCF